MDDIREIRFLVKINNDLRKLAKLAFSKSDASFYIFPYAPKGKYYFGGRHMDEVEFEDTFRFIDALSSDNIPKLSVHQSGQVHIQASGVRAGPVSISPFVDWRGQHIASIGSDNFYGLAAFEGNPIGAGPEMDFVIPAGQLTESGRLVFYLAGDKPSFTEENCQLVITLRRHGLEKPIYIGIQPKAQPPLLEAKLAGVTALAGWSSQPEEDKGVNYLYIRGV